jgi:hypothetical protein
VRLAQRVEHDEVVDEAVGEQVRSGNLNLKLTHAGNDRVANRLIEGIITGALLLASSILWQARAVPVVGGVPILAAVALAMSALLAVHLLVLVRRSGASDRGYERTTFEG